MRKGLATLNVLPQIEKHPDLFEHLFVDKVGNVTSDFVKNLQQLPDEDSSSASKRSIQMLVSSLDNAEVSDLQDFVQLVTGSCSVTSEWLLVAFGSAVLIQNRFLHPHASWN